MSACRSCGAAIIWAATVKGKTIPLDAAPAESGNIRLGLIGGEKVALVLSGAELAAAQIEGPVYLSHFVTCPNAAAHRRAR